MPAFAGRTAYSSLSAKKTAKKALKVARGANARSKQALTEAKKKGSGKTGKRGPTGKKGATGPAGPSASSSASSATSTALATGTQVIQASITTKFKANIMASASAQLSADGGDNDEASCYLNRGDGSSANDISQRVTTAIPDTASKKQTIAVDGATVQSAGSYTIKLYCSATAGAVTFDQGNLNVWAIAAS